MSELKQEIENKSFWKSSSLDEILPDRNLLRGGYIDRLKDLSEVNMVLALLGQRRVGKSVLARQFIYELRDSGTPTKNILYINFFLKQLIPLRKENVFQEIFNWWHNEISNSTKVKYLILDEVQELENWDENIASIFEDPTITCKIIITGSNSKLFSESLSTKLGGRYATIQVFPFSYFEFCEFEKLKQGTKSIEEYLTKGGMPEALKSKNEELTDSIITNIIDSTVKYDIITRYNPTNPNLLFSLTEFCRASFAREISINSIRSELMNSKKWNYESNSKTTTLIETYIEYLRDIYFIELPRTYSYRTKDLLRSAIDKIYLGDLSMASFDSTRDKGRRLENMMYFELRRLGFSIQRFLGYRNKNLEIDFHIERRTKKALIQVCWQLGDRDESSQLWDREFGNLHYTNYDIPKIVCSLDEEVVSPYGDVQHMNVIEFLRWAKL